LKITFEPCTKLFNRMWNYPFKLSFKWLGFNLVIWFPTIYITIITYVMYLYFGNVCNTNVLWYFSRPFQQSKDGLIWTMFESPNVDSNIQGTLGLPKFPKQKLNLESHGVPRFDSHILHMGVCFIVFSLDLTSHIVTLLIFLPS
jgi:hypothetical protein